jgi:hypothetical protein
MSVGDRLKSIMMKVPGYRGYAERESRRAADKELRVATAAAFASQVTRITRVQEQMITVGDFTRPEQLDRIIGRLQHLADRIRTASYGFSGFFDDDKVDEVVLDRLYAFDLEIANGVEQVGDLIARLGGRQGVDEAISLLRDKLDQLHETFSQRQHLINTFPNQESLETPVTGDGEARSAWQSEQPLEQPEEGEDGFEDVEESARTDE